MPGEAAFRIPSHVLYREVDGQMVLLDVEREEYFGLNEVGAEIVTEITAGSVDEALEALSGRYEVDPLTLRRDAEELIGSLLEAGLLAPADAG
jgi:hypothetical protein